MENTNENIQVVKNTATDNSETQVVKTKFLIYGSNGKIASRLAKLIASEEDNVVIALDDESSKKSLNIIHENIDYHKGSSIFSVIDDYVDYVINYAHTDDGRLDTDIDVDGKCMGLTYEEFPVGYIGTNMLGYFNPIVNQNREYSYIKNSEGKDVKTKGGILKKAKKYVVFCRNWVRVDKEKNGLVAFGENKTPLETMDNMAIQLLIEYCIVKEMPLLIVNIDKDKLNDYSDDRLLKLKQEIVCEQTEDIRIVDL